MLSIAGAEVYRWNCETDGDWQYTILNDDTACIVGYTDPDFEGILTIPDQVGGHIVTKVGGLRSMNKITKVIFPESVKVIRDRAFYLDRALEEVVLPSSLVSIESDAFGFCFLKSIEIPESVTSIGNSAFAGTKLKSVQLPSAEKLVLGDNPFVWTDISRFTVPEDHPNLGTYQGVLFDKIEKKLISYPAASDDTYTIPKGIKAIGGGAFNGSLLEHITIPETVVEIGEGAFLNSALTEVTLPDSVQSIGDYTFGYSAHLRQIRLGHGLRTIGDSAFSGCSLLPEIDIPENVQKVGTGLFIDCDSLTELRVSDQNPFFCIQNHCLVEKDSARVVAFPCGLKIETLEIPDGIRTIGERAFQHAHIRNVVLSGSVEVLEGMAFYKMPTLESIQLNNGLMVVSSGCFMDSENLVRITIPRSVGYLGDNAFYGNDRVSAQVEKDSYAESYCQRHSIPYTFISAEEETGKIPVSAPVLGFSGISAENLTNSTKEFLQSLRMGKGFPEENQEAEFPGMLNVQELRDFGKALFENGSAAACPECMEGTWLISLSKMDEVDEDLSTRTYDGEQYTATADQLLRREGKEVLAHVNLSRNGIFYQFEKESTDAIRCTVGLFESSEEMHVEYFAGYADDVYSSCLIWETDEDDSYRVRYVCYKDENDPETRSESITHYTSDGQCLGTSLQE